MHIDPDTISDDATKELLATAIDNDAKPIRAMVQDARDQDLETLAGLVGVDSSRDDLALVMDRLLAAEEKAARIRQLLETALKAWCKEHGSITIGTMLYWFGTKKGTPKVIDKGKTLDFLIGVCGGDAETAAKEYMAAQPFKHGAIKKQVGEETWAQHFVVEDKEVLEEKTLQMADTRFME